MIDIYNEDLYKLCSKKKYIIECCIPPVGMEVYNHLEDSHCKINDTSRVLMKGLWNEIWVIDIKTLMNSYRFADGTEINEESLKERGKYIDDELIMNWQEIISKRNSDKYAQFIPKIYKIQIKTKYDTYLNVNSDASSSDHGDGDYILCSKTIDGKPDLNNMWVVDGNIFEKTYRFKD